MIEKEVASYNVLETPCIKANVKKLTEQSYICDLVDSEGNTIAVDRRFFFSDAPFDTLNFGEKAFLNGETPTYAWYKEEIKLWLDKHQIEYSDNDLKADLLAKVENEEAE
jgi:hypothetical protein